MTPTDQQDEPSKSDTPDAQAPSVSEDPPSQLPSKPDETPDESTNEPTDDGAGPPALVPKTPDSRSLPEHATDRIMYSDALRRLGGVTQVVSSDERSLFHTRLTHTLKVAQISRRLAQHLLRVEANDGAITHLGGLNPDVAEAAGLAHDLGHPPFGHVGEGALNEKCEDWGLDGFEGNAQTFRILAKLQRGKDPAKPGLDLPPEVMNAVIKYPWLREGPRAGSGKWNAYPTEREQFKTARGKTPEGVQSLEAAIMDWADDITYAVHDTEDFIRAGSIPMARLVNDAEERERFVDVAAPKVIKKAKCTEAEVREAFETLATWQLRHVRQYRGTVEDRATLHRDFGVLIGVFVGSASLGTRSDPLIVPKEARIQVEILKQLTWFYIIHDPALASLQRGHRRVILGLFDDLMAWMPLEREQNAIHRLPTPLNDLWLLAESEVGDGDYKDDDARRARAVADYISSLTEAQAIDLYGRLRGRPGQTVGDRWLGY